MKTFNYVKAVAVLAVVIAVGASIILLLQNQKIQLALANLKSTCVESIVRNSIIEEQAPEDSVIYYAPLTGNLSLVIQDDYAVIENLDGNKGGARGARFKIGHVLRNGVISDNGYNYVQIDIDDGNESVSDFANFTAKRLLGEGFTNILSSETTVGGQIGYRIEGDGVAYASKIVEYVTVSKGFEYRIRMIGDTEILDAVMAGIEIK